MTTASETTEDGQRRRRRRFVVVGLLVVVAAVAVWGVVAASVLLRGRDHAEAGRDVLRQLSSVDPLDGDLEELRTDLRQAGAEVGEARRALNEAVLTPLRPLPVVGRQLASARALATTADEVIASVAPALDRVIDGREAGSEAGQRLELLADLESQLGRARDVLRDADLGPDEALLAPLADARNEAAEELGELSDRVGDALTAVSGMRSFLDGASYVILAANPAEMANTGGMYLSVGELRTRDGDFVLDEFKHSGALFPVPAGDETDPDVAARWGHVAPGNDFRKLNISPRFATYSGPRALDLWEAVSGNRATGTLVLDPTIIQAVLQVIGPIEYEGATYDSSTILDYALIDQYVTYDDRADDQGERREVVAGVARAAVQALGERSWDPLDLLRALRPAAEGRHLLLYSEEPAEQELWTLAGVDGTIAGDELLVNLANTGAQKVDPFVSMDIAASVATEGQDHRLRLDVTVANRAPEDLPDISLGSYEITQRIEPGTYLGRLAVFGPWATSAARFEPELPLDTFGRDGPLLAMVGRTEIPAGETAQYTVELTLAEGIEELTVIPSGRPEPITWHWGDETWQDTERRTIALG